MQQPEVAPDASQILPSISWQALAHFKQSYFLSSVSLLVYSDKRFHSTSLCLQINQFRSPARRLFWWRETQKGRREIWLGLLSPRRPSFIPFPRGFKLGGGRVTFKLNQL